MYPLVIAIFHDEDGMTYSRNTSLTDINAIAAYMEAECNSMPDEILIVQNGNIGPKVVSSYYRGHHYDVE